MENMTQWEQSEFEDEHKFVLPTEAFSDYVEHPQVRRLYLTDVGILSHAKNHYKEREDGSEENIFFYCTAGSGTIIVDRKKSECDL